MAKDTISKTNFKIQVSVAIAVMLFLLSAGFYTGIRLERTDGQIAQLQKDCNDLKQRTVVLETENNDIKIQLAEINTKLTNIETSLLEIKLDIKKFNEVG